MSTIEETRALLVKKLKEMFQLDKPELDFGFYRIMHQREKEVSQFIEKDLMVIVQKHLGNQSNEEVEKLRKELEKARDEAKKYGVQDPDSTKPVEEIKTKLKEAENPERLEKELYENLIRFFGRYYENGDFLSRRYYTTETADRAAPYAIPYNGEEVKLFWANSDQYYIKTSETFTNFSFCLNKSRVDEQKDHDDQNALRVHFRVVNVSPETQNNNKTADDQKRFFIIHRPEPFIFNEAGELIVQFEYRPDPEGKGKQEKSRREDKIKEAVEVVLSELTKETSKGPNQNRSSDYLYHLMANKPTDKNKNRTVLESYLVQYTARNTCDYFIHKDLKGFLTRELDFYIKNEMMRLDDIQEADERRLESYLGQFKAFRQIGKRIIEFLAQLENYQKKLYLKKKFVVESNYCVTLDRIPEDFYEEIANNDGQREEWIRLFAIDEIKPSNGDLLDSGNTGYSNPLSIDFLKTNPNLVLDTRFFSHEFKERIIEALSTNCDLDRQCEGLLLNSDNFQALRLLEKRYKGQIKCAYIDPPYNTGNDGFVYKDNYRHSSWLSMMYSSLLQAKCLLKANGIVFISIDDNEVNNLRNCCNSIFGESNFIVNLIWNKQHSQQQGLFTQYTENILVYAREDGVLENISGGSGIIDAIALKKISKANPKSEFSFPAGVRFEAKDGKCFTGTYGNTERIEVISGRLLAKNGKTAEPVTLAAGWTQKEQMTSYFKGCEVRDTKGQKVLEFYFTSTGKLKCLKERERITPSNLLPEYGRVSDQTEKLAEMMGDYLFNTPKPVKMIGDFCKWFSSNDDIVLDFFAGSGTTAHAVINQNYDDGSCRKYILVEMGDYFDTVLKPRIEKVLYAPDWKGGKPIQRNNGKSHCFKYIRLESYEDTLNNIHFDHDNKRESVLNDNTELYEDFFLRYMLDAETEGSVCLVNCDCFKDPMNYRMNIRRPGSAEITEQTIDLVETFNYLIGLRPTRISASRHFDANFTRNIDPELPDEYKCKLILEGELTPTPCGKWWFRSIEGNIIDIHSQEQKHVLIIWRNLTDDLEKDNVILNTWFEMMGYSQQAKDLDCIYVNGDNNLMNLCGENNNWNIRQTEGEFRARLWEE